MNTFLLAIITVKLKKGKQIPKKIKKDLKHPQILFSLDSAIT